MFLLMTRLAFSLALRLTFDLQRLGAAVCWDVPLPAWIGKLIKIKGSFFFYWRHKKTAAGPKLDPSPTKKAAFLLHSPTASEKTQTSTCVEDVRSHACRGTTGFLLLMQYIHIKAGNCPPSWAEECELQKTRDEGKKCTISQNRAKSCRTDNLSNKSQVKFWQKTTVCKKKFCKKQKILYLGSHDWLPHDKNSVSIWLIYRFPQLVCGGCTNATVIYLSIFQLLVTLRWKLLSKQVNY